MTSPSFNLVTILTQEMLYFNDENHLEKSNLFWLRTPTSSPIWGERKWYFHNTTGIWQISSSWMQDFIWTWL